MSGNSNKKVKEVKKKCKLRNIVSENVVFFHFVGEKVNAMPCLYRHIHIAFYHRMSKSTLNEKQKQKQK